MKWIPSGVFLAIAFVAAAQGATGARSAPTINATVRTVYIPPMSGGLDLYVAQWLARNQTVHVTTDPKNADAILTDHLGEDFEHKLDQLLAKKDDHEKAGNSSQSERYSPGRNRGTVFLVDSKTRQVLWSDYEKPPAYRSSDKLNHEAREIVKKLSESLGGTAAPHEQRNGG
jgi:hypothetical protein